MCGASWKRLPAPHTIQRVPLPPALDFSDRSAQALAAAEAENAAAERRQELFVLFRNGAKVYPEEGYAVAGPPPASPCL